MQKWDNVEGKLNRERGYGERNNNLFERMWTQKDTAFKKPPVFQWIIFLILNIYSVWMQTLYFWHHRLWYTLTTICWGRGCELKDNIMTHTVCMEYSVIPTKAKAFVL